MSVQKIVIFSVVFLMGMTGFGMWGCPQYWLYQKKLDGQANLLREESQRKIAIEEAKAKLESAKFLSKAEVERARGVAEANKIIGNSLKNNDSYLRYLWIQGLHDGTSETIYIPTEANLPILEATRRQKKIVNKINDLEQQ